MGLRLLSLNTWSGRLYDQMLPFLKETNPDILCLQEVNRKTGSAPDWLYYMDRDTHLPHRADLFNDLKAYFSDHQAFYFPVARGSLYEDKKNPFLVEYGLATFVRASMPVIGNQVRFTYGGFRPDGWGEQPISRVAHGVKVFDYAKDRSLTVIHLHGIWDKAGKKDNPERVKQAEALVEMVGLLAAAGEPIVVCGDFNVLPGSVTFEKLSEIGLMDLVTTRTDGKTRTSHYPKDGKFAAYTFVSSAVDVADFRVVVSPEVSDHRAMILDIA